MTNIEKMNVYIITKDKVMKSEKEGRWFNNLFLPLFKSNKDPLKKQPQLNDYWNEIRNVLLGKKKNKNLKVIKHKDIKFIAFPVANNRVLAFATGTEKSEALNDIYKLSIKEDKTITAVKNSKQTNEVSNNKPDSKLFELIKKQLKPYGEVKKVDKINFDDSARINIQIVTKKSEEEMWDIINKVVKPLFNNKFDVEVEEVSNYDYMNTLLCPVLLKMKIKTGRNTLEKDINQSLAEVEHDFVTGLINYEDAVDTILDIGEANSESDAQAIVDAWELKNKKDTGKADKVKFKIYLDEVKEPEEELKKLEHHFDWLYGDTNPGDYWDVKVDYHTDRYTIISGYISGVDREDFEANIREGMDNYHALLKDIDWLEPLTGKELEKSIKDTMDEYEEVGQPFEQEEQFELINEEYLVDKKEFDKYWNKIVH